MRHYIKKSLISGNHRVEIALVGCGGTGSKVLNNLAKIHHSLIELGHPGLRVCVYDDDIVSQANLGRQVFALSDVGHPKATLLVSRVNAYLGLDWKAIFDRYPSSRRNSRTPDVVITSVDTAKARLEVETHLKENVRSCYWLDFGNSKVSGQIVLGTIGSVDQPESSTFETADRLPCVTDLFPNLEDMDETDDTPSCSVRDALLKQDLFTNSILADLGCNMLWNLFKNYYIERHGFFANIEEGITSPVMINSKVWKRFGFVFDNDEVQVQ